MDGKVVAIIGLALCMTLCGIGSAVGLYKAGVAAAGVIAEDNKKFSKVLVLAVLPATQGIYGFVITILGMGKIAAVTTTAAGLSVFGAVMPMAIVGCISAIYQGLTAVGSILAVSKDETVSGKMILFPAMVETYAILSLVITIMLLGQI